MSPELAIPLMPLRNSSPYSAADGSPAGAKAVAKPFASPLSSLQTLRNVYHTFSNSSTFYPTSNCHVHLHQTNRSNHNNRKSTSYLLKNILASSPSITTNTLSPSNISNHHLLTCIIDFETLKPLLPTAILTRIYTTLMHHQQRRNGAPTKTKHSRSMSKYDCELTASCMSRTTTPSVVDSSVPLSSASTRTIVPVSSKSAISFKHHLKVNPVVGINATTVQSNITTGTMNTDVSLVPTSSSIVSRLKTTLK
ncbi:hypothetical protein BDF19DRAFT_435514 [Syncephalis fuscata]|nr:hypothetical protein BDF19DRAFT_435514 [Syncephalis fuscata]